MPGGSPSASAASRAAASLVDKLLPVLDALDLATDHVGDNDSDEAKALIAANADRVTPAGTVRVVVSYTDGNGTLESVPSTATAAVTVALNEAPTETIKTTDKKDEGKTLEEIQQQDDNSGGRIRLKQ